MIRKILHYINLGSEIEDYNIIHATIESGIVFKGTNLWILAFAIIIASVGLNTNSTAVIIGAMLISPLMGPINGMGYSIATYDFVLLRRSVKNFTFAVIASLIASTLYFAISPVSKAHSELLARTSPTIYDVLIALFGGLAGIVAISTKIKGNVIPGVAIATALMPPLCTAGYGIATGQYKYFFGASYLFTINTVFIAISSVIIAQVLKFPIRKSIEESHKKRINQWLTIIIIITLMPSIYFGYLLIQKENFKENAAKFTKSVSFLDGSYLIKSEVTPENTSIRLIYGGNNLTEEQKLFINQRAEEFMLEKSQIVISQGFSLDVRQNEQSESELLKAEINRLNNLLNMTKKQKDSIEIKPHFGKILLKELKSIFPDIYSCSYSETIVFDSDTTKKNTIPVLIITSSRKQLPRTEQNNISNWFRVRMQNDNSIVIIK